MNKKQKELDADVVVIGTGASGLCTALTAASGGAGVILLEKMPSRGGMSNFAEGLFAVESKIQKINKIGITVEQAFKNHMENTHWLPNARLVRTFMDKTSDTVEWLEKVGVTFSGVKSIYPDGPLVWHMIKGNAAAGLIKPLLEKIKKDENIRILLQTSARSLLMKKGKAVGVIAEDKEGNQIRAKCKAVVVASGGFQNNEEWLEKYCRGGRFISAFVPSKQTGDAIQMAWDVGAAPYGLGVVQAFPFVPGERNLGSHLLTAGMHPYLWVNQRGERFCDESIVWRFPVVVNALSQQPNGAAFCIFDENTKTYFKEQGVQYTVGEFLTPSTKLTKLDKDIERGVKGGKAFVGDSLNSLAEKMGMDASVLQATVDEYNACCAKNYDFLFGKDRRYLQPVRTSNFYAIKLVVKVLITEGGIKINHKMEVMDKEDNVIPGLYAVGCCAGGLVGETYNLDTTGGSLSFAVNSGRIAGENILDYFGK